MSERGKYIVIEGHDGTGKSTQVEQLAERLFDSHGIESFVAHEPAGTPMADAIRTVLKNGDLQRDADTNMLLFTAARHEIWNHARHELALGKWVLSARSYLSTIAYQVWGETPDATRGDLAKRSQYVIDFTRQFTDDDYMNPDATIVLQLDDPATRTQRITSRATLEQPDTFESRDEAFQQRVAMGYDYVAETANATRINVMDGRNQRSVEHINEEIWSMLVARDILAKHIT